MEAGQLENLLHLSEGDMQCSRDVLSLSVLATRAAEVRGCGKIREYALVCQRAGRCNWEPIVPAVFLASQALGCPIEHCQVVSPTATVRDVNSCGQWLRYRLSCSGGGCRWLIAPYSPSLPPPPSSQPPSYDSPPTSYATPSPG
ncbi:MAG: hypothetical protein N2515_05585 [Deltaproteobacteria bacterium]|nr:hypothetical protein [Deltaproteobacteria bacterium]